LTEKNEREKKEEKPLLLPVGYCQANSLSSMFLSSDGMPSKQPINVPKQTGY